MVDAPPDVPELPGEPPVPAAPITIAKEVLDPREITPSA
jgi:hypothetical protein